MKNLQFFLPLAIMLGGCAMEAPADPEPFRIVRGPSFAERVMTGAVPGSFEAETARFARIMEEVRAEDARLNSNTFYNQKAFK